MRMNEAMEMAYIWLNIHNGFLNLTLSEPSLSLPFCSNMARLFSIFHAVYIIQFLRAPHHGLPLFGSGSKQHEKIRISNNPIQRQLNQWITAMIRTPANELNFSKQLHEKNNNTESNQNENQIGYGFNLSICVLPPPYMLRCKCRAYTL